MSISHVPSVPRIAFTNARLLDPASGTDADGGVLVVGDSIADAGANLFAGGVPSDAQVIDCGGLCLAPGLIDMRAQLGEPGLEHLETFASASQAAAAGGITTMIATPDTDPVIDNVALVDFIERHARATSQVSIDPMAAITKGLNGRELVEMGLLTEAGAVAFNDGQQAVADAGVMRRALQYAKTFGALIVQHAEEPALSRGGAMNAGETATRLGLPGIPAVAEVILIERDLRLVEVTGGRWHAAGVSTKGAIEAIRRAKDKGLAVTCGISPVHFALNELECHDYKTFAKVSPPLRAEEDRVAMIEAMADGTIDVICSNHIPQDTDAKRQPFAEAAFGAAGLETLLAVSLQPYHAGKIDLLRLLEMLTAAPAQLLQKRAGRLSPGAPADLVLFDPDRPWLIDRDKLRGKCRNTPFDRKPITGRVIQTVVAGRTIFQLNR